MVEQQRFCYGLIIVNIVYCSLRGLYHFTISYYILTILLSSITLSSLIILPSSTTPSFLPFFFYLSTIFYHFIVFIPPTSYKYSPYQFTFAYHLHFLTLHFLLLFPYNFFLHSFSSIYCFLPFHQASFYILCCIRVYLL